MDGSAPAEEPRRQGRLGRAPGTVWRDPPRAGRRVGRDDLDELAIREHERRAVVDGVARWQLALGDEPTRQGPSLGLAVDNLSVAGALWSYKALAARARQIRERLAQRATGRG